MAAVCVLRGRLRDRFLVGALVDTLSPCAVGSASGHPASYVRTELTLM